MSAIRNDWTIEDVQNLLQLPFNDLMFKAQSVHREHFSPNEVQVSTLLSIKNRRVPGRLQILSAKCALSHRA